MNVNSSVFLKQMYKLLALQKKYARLYCGYNGFLIINKLRVWSVIINNNRYMPRNTVKQYSTVNISTVQ